jgi:hypothetical protein
MSEELPLLHDRRTAEQAGPLAVLIADAVANIGSLRRAAAAITDATWDLDHTRTSTHPSPVNDWIAGAVPHRRTRRAIAAGLNIPLPVLTRAAEAQQAARRANLQAVRTPTLTGQQVESDDMKRREFARLVALGGASALTGIDLDRFAAILAGTRADERALDDFERITLDLIGQEATVSPQSLMPAVRGHLAGLCDVLVWTPPALASRAHSLAGQAALLAGYLWYQQDNHAQADMYWSLVERFGDIAGDVRLRAVLLELQANRWSPPYSTDNLPQARAALDRAVALLGPSPDPAAAAYLLSFRAHHYAKASRAQPDYAARAMRDLDLVQTHLSRMRSPDASVYIIHSVAGEAAHQHGRALVELSRPGHGVAHLERLLQSVDDRKLSWRAGIVSDLAAAHAAMGESEHAAGLLIEATGLAALASSGRKLNRIRLARQRWLISHNGPALRRLDDQLRALPAAPISAGPPPAASA